MKKSNKHVYGVFQTKEEAEDAVRTLMDLGYSTDEISIDRDDDQLTVYTASDRELIDPAELTPEGEGPVSGSNAKAGGSAIEDRITHMFERIDKLNKISKGEAIDGRILTASTIEDRGGLVESPFDEDGLLKDTFKEDANNPKIGRLDSEAYPYDKKVMHVSNKDDFSKTRYEHKEVVKSKFKGEQSMDDETKSEE